MTMPDVIYAIDARKRPEDSPSGVWSERGFYTRDAYIRKDLADDLARDLQLWLDELPDDDWIKGPTRDLLARYNSATEGK